MVRHPAGVDGHHVYGRVWRYRRHPYGRRTPAAFLPGRYGYVELLLHMLDLYFEYLRVQCGYFRKSVFSPFGDAGIQCDQQSVDIGHSVRVLCDRIPCLCDLRPGLYRPPDLVCPAAAPFDFHDGWPGPRLWYHFLFPHHKVSRPAGAAFLPGLPVDVRNPYRVPVEPDRQQILHGRPGSYLHVPEPCDSYHRDLQVWFPRLRRICRMAVADL